MLCGRILNGGGWFALGVCLALVATATSGAEDEPARGHVRLINGDFAHGAFIGCSQANHIDWMCKEFDRPMMIEVIHMQRLETGQTQTAAAGADFRFNIHGGSSLSGQWLAADEERILIRNEALGEIAIPHQGLSQIRRIETPSDVVFPGIASDQAIFELAEKLGWRFEGQSLVANKPVAAIRTNAQLPLQSRIDLRMSWEGSPQFVVALGVDEKDTSDAFVPRLEVWDRGLVLVQQVKGQADATFLKEIGDAETDVSLTIYLDQPSGLVGVFSAAGTLLGKIQLPDNPQEVRHFISFLNLGTTWSIDSLTVSNWNGVLPYPYGQPATNETIARKELTGRIKRMDAARNVLTIESDDGKNVEVPLRELATFVSKDSQSRKATQTGDAGLPLVQLTFTDGSQLTGELMPAPPGSIGIRSKSLSDVHRCQVKYITSIRKHSDTITALPSAVNRMKLKMPGIELSGHLAEVTEASPQSMLAFQPLYSKEKVGISETSSGTIGTARPPSTATASGSVPMVRLNGNVGVIVPARMRQAEEADSSLTSVYRTPRDLQLRSGEMLDASIASIDESGITFESSATSCTFLPHEAIHSAQLKIPLRGTPIDPKKMERLLTVPRMRRDNPPTHLVITANGDYLRGKLIRLTKEIVEFEEGLSTITIPRNAVAVIIWLHDRLWEAKSADGPPEKEAKGDFLVHVRLRSAGRFTFRPEKVDREKIYGTSTLLGAIHCNLTQIESIEFGKGLIERLQTRDENAWRLQLAKAPMVFQETDPNGLPTTEQLGMGSEMVGKSAPNFELKTLSGTRWRLGDQLGKTVVLDFWASWCGPCMQAMPEVERLVTDLNRPDFIWVGINLQETSERAKLAMERLQIQSLVLLDEDGGVGMEYDARAIPLTVIVGADGLVKHVFVGGGNETLAAIEKSLRALVELPNVSN